MKIIIILVQQKQTVIITYVKNMLFEILSKCPRYFNQGPAAEM